MNTKMKTIQHFNSKIQNILIENNNDIQIYYGPFDSYIYLQSFVFTMNAVPIFSSTINFDKMRYLYGV